MRFGPIQNLNGFDLIALYDDLYFDGSVSTYFLSSVGSVFSKGRS